MLSLTESAKDYLTKVADGNFVTLTIKGGGCSGFQYVWDTISPEKLDRNEWLGPVEGLLFVDKMSEMFLLGSEVDYVTKLGGSYLDVKNPVAKGSCGCGESFSA